MGARTKTTVRKVIIRQLVTMYLRVRTALGISPPVRRPRPDRPPSPGRPPWRRGWTARCKTGHLLVDAAPADRRGDDFHPDDGSIGQDGQKFLQAACVHAISSQQERAGCSSPLPHSGALFCRVMKCRLSTRYLMPEMAVTAATSQHRTIPIRSTAPTSAGPARAAAK